MKTIKTTLLLLLGLIISQYSFAQPPSRLSFEFTAGPSIANRNLAGADLSKGGGLEATFHYRLVSHLGVYAGWGWNRFSAKESFAGENMDFEETGYVAGLEFKHPLGSSNLAGFVRVGGLYNHIEIENPDGDITDDTGHGLGFQLAGGLDIPLSQKWSLTPGIKFNSLSRNLKSDGQKTNLNLSYDCLRVGIARRF